MVPSKLVSILNDAQASLTENPKKDLILPFRKKIWRAMGAAEYNPAMTQANITMGLLRRSKLATSCADKVMHLWDKVFPDNDEPHIILSMLHDYLIGGIDRDSCWHFQNEFMGNLEELECSEFISNSEKRKHDMALNAGFASVRAMHTGLNDENISAPEEESLFDEDCDPWSWDASFYSCAAYSDGFPWNKDSNEKKRHEFWLWYIRDAVPNAYEAYPD